MGISFWEERFGGWGQEGCFYQCQQDLRIQFTCLMLYPSKSQFTRSGQCKRLSIVRLYWRKFRAHHT